ncbi:MAG: serine/threonine-protein kinase [Isosphaeraceae bacterium]
MMICPPSHVLQGLGRDSIDVEEFRAIERHVAACPDCRDQLERLACLDPSEATFWPPGPSRPALPEIPGFRIGAELGRGGFGVVYQAVQVQLGRNVALKVLNGGPVLGAGPRRRWLREARAISRVRHPHVVRLYDAGEHEDYLYLVLDLVPGGSLADRINGPMPSRSVARLVKAVARAVAQIHRDGLLHLDVKPSNILLDGPSGGPLDAMTPLLSDFGIALDEDERAVQAASAGAFGAWGTPAFMAPEQVAGPREAIGPAADVFALGATLYTLLTGRPPYQAATPGETVVSLRAREPARPRALIPSIPRDLETICLACLQNDPGRRYDSADDLADDLRRWLDGYPIRARPTSKPGHALHWCRRHPAPATLAGLLAATVLFSLIGLTALWSRAEVQRARSEVLLKRALRNESAARMVMDDLTDLLRTTVESPERFASERIKDALPVVLELSAQLRRAPDPSTRSTFAISALEVRLSEYLVRGGDPKGARRLLEDAADLLGNDPGRLASDVSLATRYADVLGRLGGLSLMLDQVDEAAHYFQCSEDVFTLHAGNSEALDPLAAQHVARVEFARALDRLGKHEAARRALIANRDRFQAISHRLSDDPMLALIHSLARFEAEPPDSTPSAVLSAFGRLPAGASLPRSLEILLADQIALELCESTATEAGRQLDLQATADRLLNTLEAHRVALRLKPALIDEIIERTSQRGSLQAVSFRRAGRYDDVRRTIGWMLCFGQTLERLGPGAVGPHLIQSRAFEQEAKLAWHAPDPVAVERSLRLALSEAATAHDLDPGDEVSRQHLAGLREKYVRLVANEPDH